MTADIFRNAEPSMSVWASRRNRWIAVALAVALHLAILALFLRSHPPLAAGQGVGAGVMDVSLAGFSRSAAPAIAHAAPAAARPEAAPTKPKPPAPADPLKPRSVVQIVSDILAIPLSETAMIPQPLVASPTPILAQATASASGGAGAGCDIGGAVQTALRSDPDAHGAVLLIPHQERSVANAVLLWNGQWIDPAVVGGATVFGAITASIRSIVAAAQPDCRQQTIVGPRFMLVPEGQGMIVVVVGNASWRWSDLLVDSNPPPA